MKIICNVLGALVFLVSALYAQPVHAVEHLEIVACDGCNNNQYVDKVLDASTHNDTVIVMDVLNRRVSAFYRNVVMEPGIRFIDVWEDTVPYQHQVSFDEYMQIYDRINSTHSTTKIWSDIPKQLSSQGVVNATATIQGVPYPIPPVLCTDFCVDTSSVHNVFTNLDAQRLIGLELNKAYTATLFMKFKIVLHKMFAKKPFAITVKFSDNTKVDFKLVSPVFTLPWAILPDTALDKEGKLIPPPLNTVHDFSGGYGEGNYLSTLNFNDGYVMSIQCKTVFTSKGYKDFVSQLVCWPT